MAKLYSITFEIIPMKGLAAALPLDMMRYDRCTPLTQEGVGELVCIEDTDMQAPIEMVHYSHGNKNWRPTSDRWKSFGWYVRNRGVREV